MDSFHTEDGCPFLDMSHVMDPRREDCTDHPCKITSQYTQRVTGVLVAFPALTHLNLNNKQSQSLQSDRVSRGREPCRSAGGVSSAHSPRDWGKDLGGGGNVFKFFFSGIFCSADQLTLLLPVGASL
jgi:hypothetical protein